MCTWIICTVLVAMYTVVRQGGTSNLHTKKIHICMYIMVRKLDGRREHLAHV